MLVEFGVFILFGLNGTISQLPHEWLEFGNERESAFLKSIYERGGSISRNVKLAGRPITGMNCRGDNILEADLRFLVRFPTLREVTIGGQAGSLDAKAISPLTELPALERLTLTGVHMTDETMAILKRMQKLRTLWIARSVTDAGLVHLTKLERLEELIVQDASLRGVGLKHLLSLKSLRSIDFSYSRFTNDSLSHIGQLKQVRTVTMRTCNLTDCDLRHLSKLTEIQALNLCDNRISNLGLHHIAQMRDL